MITESPRSFLMPYRFIHSLRKKMMKVMTSSVKKKTFGRRFPGKFFTEASLQKGVMRLEELLS